MASWKMVGLQVMKTTEGGEELGGRGAEKGGEKEKQRKDTERRGK